MHADDYSVRWEKEKDYREVENLVREAFWNIYGSGCVEHYILHQMREHKDFIKDLDFVMEKNRKIIGQIAFIKSSIQTTDSKKIPSITLRPISIIQSFRGRGYGSMLLDHAIEQAKQMGFGVIFTEGSREFFGNSGFIDAGTKGISSQGTLLCKELKPHFLEGIKGKYIIPEVYSIEEEKVREFDKEFPYRE